MNWRTSLHTLRAIVLNPRAALGFSAACGVFTKRIGHWACLKLFSFELDSSFIIVWQCLSIWYATLESTDVVWTNSSKNLPILKYRRCLIRKVSYSSSVQYLDKTFPITTATWSDTSLFLVKTTCVFKLLSRWMDCLYLHKAIFNSYSWLLRTVGKNWFFKYMTALIWASIGDMSTLSVTICTSSWYRTSTDTASFSTFSACSLSCFFDDSKSWSCPSSHCFSC